MTKSTLNTCYAMDDRHAKVYLFSLVVKQWRAGKGVPVAWMLTPHETQYPIMNWLRRVRSSVPSFVPETFVLDCSDTEATVARLAFADACRGEYDHYGERRTSRVFEYNVVMQYIWPSYLSRTEPAQ
ncbi:BZ3500_MvSof-1268-A1-R1_Chr4-2g07133 [Microbotryum saponariae]|uniref:BZ3500_MvSof-1268-A1-R1_Chr4-2g07133 protein n=1 Tax=Microbotryum saponariae TaxID=289078 RepID=A0A2X0LND5_9BASI|nr:BZ3500_MvSof-1268-A1-R1_Chr4-2g07133 [Microbotryum saponariae]SDA06798.1 BZ3501_MvSof-1269-A2-R1_Chr4-2g06844 [Microbotryum saponariae]